MLTIVTTNAGTLTNDGRRSVNAALRAAGEPALARRSDTALDVVDVLAGLGIECKTVRWEDQSAAQRGAHTRAVNKRAARRAASTGFVRDKIRAAKSA